MKKIITLLFIATLLISACSKDKGFDLDEIGANTGLIEFKLNGKPQKHTFMVAAGEKPESGIDQIIAGGGKGEPNENGDRPSIDFFLVEEAGAKVGKLYTSVSGELVGQYYLPLEKGVFANYSSGTYDMNDNPGYFEVEFTEINDRGMKGRFSGIMYDIETKAKLVVEDGTFDMLYTDFIFD